MLINANNLPPATIDPIWNYLPPGADFTNFDLYKDYIYLISPTKGVCKLSPKGKPVWTYQVAVRNNGLWCYRDRILVLTSKNILLCLDSELGFPHWQYPVSASLNQDIIFWDNLILFPTVDGLIAIDTQTGSLIWESKLTNDIQYYGLVNRQTLLALGNKVAWPMNMLDGKIGAPITLPFGKINSCHQGLSGLDLLTEEGFYQLSSQNGIKSLNCAPTRVIWLSDNLWMQTDDNWKWDLYQDNLFIVSLQLADDPLGILVPSGKIILVLATNGKLTAFDRSSGDEVWQTNFDKPYPDKNIILRNGEDIYYLTHNGQMHHDLLTIEPWGTPTE